MPSWSSRIIPASYQSHPQGLSHTHSQPIAAGGIGLGGAGSSTGNPPQGDRVPRLSGSHARSHSYQVISGTSESAISSAHGQQGPTIRGQPSDSSLRPGAGDRNVELTTGKCMCCDSTVRWPKHLNVFRCMICMTINDLKPTTPPEEKLLVPEISISETRAIIEYCISNFLENKAKFEMQAHNISSIDNSSSSVLASSDHPLLPGLLDEKRQLFQDGGNFPTTMLDIQELPESVVVGTAELTLKGNEGATCLRSYDSISIDYTEGRKRQKDLAEKMFKPLEGYIAACFSSWKCLNNSFLPDNMKEKEALSAPSFEARFGKADNEEPAKDKKPLIEDEYGKQLLTAKSRSKDREQQRERENARGKVNIKSPIVDWISVKEWYDLIIDAGADLVEIIRAEENTIGKREGTPVDQTASEKLKEKERPLDTQPNFDSDEWVLADSIEIARSDLMNALLKATESFLRRPGRSLKGPSDIRFFLIILGNPLLYPSYSRPRALLSPSRKQEKTTPPNNEDIQVSKIAVSSTSHALNSGSGPGQHSGIIKRIVGLISVLPNTCHHYLVSWFSRLPEDQFRRIVELGGSFITYRLTRQHGRKKSLGGIGMGGKRGRGVVYHDDWQIRAAARFMALLFSANNHGRSTYEYSTSPMQSERDGGPSSPGELARQQARNRGQIILTSDFYNMLLDYADLIADFDSWENRSSKFCFCQYPFLFSMGAKIHILEYDARRQMEVKAREAFFSSLTNRRAINQYLVLKVRRNCLVEDSLRGISEGVGGVGDIKKGLRIEFVGEDGVDAGGLRKEWFLLLVRDVFDPNYGLFVYDEDSRYCYFNPNSFESSEEFFLIGVVFGLAIYNSTILDVALPPCVFKKLLQSPSPGSILNSASLRPPLKHTLDDLAIFRPALARGLRQLLEFEGDVEEVYCRNFAVEVDRFGQRLTIPLLPGGENIPVTNSNRKDFVDKYITYLLDTSVAKQFEPFKRGFYTVCAGNALSLFRPEEIELLVRGSDEPLDISALRSVAIYEGWSDDSMDAPTAENDPVVRWFWSFFERITPKEQRLLLIFITGSDRIPAMGATNLVIKLVCLGGDCDRFPVARTCFNALCLYRYKKREKLEKMLWRAVEESEGFGLK